MSIEESFLDQLADVPVPPPPPDLDNRVHQSVNHWLLAAHLGDLAVRGFPFAVMHFARAVAGALSLTSSGRYPADGNDQTES